MWVLCRCSAVFCRWWLQLGGFWLDDTTRQHAKLFEKRPELHWGLEAARVCSSDGGQWTGSRWYGAAKRGADLPQVIVTRVEGGRVNQPGLALSKQQEAMGDFEVSMPGAHVSMGRSKNSKAVAEKPGSSVSSSPSSAVKTCQDSWDSVKPLMASAVEHVRAVPNSATVLSYRAGQQSRTLRRINEDLCHSDIRMEEPLRGPEMNTFYCVGSHGAKQRKFSVPPCPDKTIPSLK
ncbi:hypothetical protein QBC36DRAFT_306808 [Triangularia setosa]|uniref:Uncharacterized protein n=1 Tax=Triangularia setosa TaxID=2587417 RepID=A0AAN6WFS2_9PEZI|nr:hypothetical protein QBC36DRAFT_306808 [Podospora setosa]